MKVQEPKGRPHFSLNWGYPPGKYPPAGVHDQLSNPLPLVLNTPNILKSTTSIKY